MRFVATVFALSLTACAHTSGVLQAGPETFTISTSASFGAGGVPAAKRQAYEEANAECTKRGLQVLTVAERETPQNIWKDGMSHVDLDFKCQRPA